MLAHAALVAEASEGRLTLPVLRSDPPILLRPTGDTVHLVGGSAGPLGGDQLGLQAAKEIAEVVLVPGKPAGQQLAERVAFGHR